MSNTADNANQRTSDKKKGALHQSDEKHVESQDSLKETKKTSDKK